MTKRTKPYSYKEQICETKKTLREIKQPLEPTLKQVVETIPDINISLKKLESAPEEFLSKLDIGSYNMKIFAARMNAISSLLEMQDDLVEYKNYLHNKVMELESQNKQTD